MKDEVDRIFEYNRIKEEESEKMYRKAWMISGIIFLPFIMILPLIFIHTSISSNGFQGALWSVIISFFVFWCINDRARKKRKARIQEERNAACRSIKRRVDQLFHAESEPRHATGMVLDPSERQALELNLGRANNLVEKIIDYAMLTPRLNIRYLESNLGASREDILGTLASLKRQGIFSGELDTGSDTFTVTEIMEHAGKEILENNIEHVSQEATGKLFDIISNHVKPVSTLGVEVVGMMKPSNMVRPGQDNVTFFAAIRNGNMTAVSLEMKVITSCRQVKFLLEGTPKREIEAKGKISPGNEFDLGLPLEISKNANPGKYHVQVSLFKDSLGSTALGFMTGVKAGKKVTFPFTIVP
ncbi:hypothetical protein GF325_12345 [Candidatus Bathyarchaeota archaeon]|nr:hypothetical protein [Candidatus Bathyarchaeota archaeon]